tara:strand:+ start:209 stop:379 length:171 start_codon:yes stop_codon:yes gene_type:complete
MAIGLGIGIGIPSGALNSNRAGGLIPGLLVSLKARADYFENEICTISIMQELENCT